MTTYDDLVAFHAAEALHWQTRYEALHQRVYDAHQALTGADLGMCELWGDDDPFGPPEPPVGTSFVLDGHTIWRRDTNGWRCDDRHCAQCPCSWSEARNWRPQDWNRTVRHLPTPDLPAVSP